VSMVYIQTTLSQGTAIVCSTACIGHIQCYCLQTQIFDHERKIDEDLVSTLSFEDWHQSTQQLPCQIVFDDEFLIFVAQSANYKNQSTFSCCWWRILFRIHIPTHHDWLRRLANDFQK